MTDLKTLVTPVGKVGFYALDRPFRDSGKYSMTITLDLNSQEAKDFQKEVGKNASVIEKVIDGKPVLQIGGSTKFDSFLVADATGKKIEAPADVRTNQGDVMLAKMVVSPYNYEFQSKKGTALNLLAATIVSHDTKDRVVVEGDGSSKDDMLAALMTETKLATLKG